MGIINCACTATFPENVFDWLVDGVPLYGGKILGRQKKGALLVDLRRVNGVLKGT